MPIIATCGCDLALVAKKYLTTPAGCAVLVCEACYSVGDSRAACGALQRLNMESP